MVKLARSPYRTAKRSPEWMKYKLNKQDEFVVVRLDRSPAARATHFGSLDPRRRMTENGFALRRRSRHRIQRAELERVMKLLEPARDTDLPVQPEAEDPVGERHAALGQATCWSRRSGTPRSPTTAGCAIPLIWDCVTTRARLK